MISNRKYHRKDVVRAADIENDRTSFLSSEAEYLEDISILSARLSIANAAVAANQAAGVLPRTQSVITSNQARITASTIPVYPTSAEYQSERDVLCGVISMPVVESRKIFITDQGNLRSGIEISIDSDIMFAFDSSTDEIYDCPPEYALIDPLPYMMICMKDDLDRVSIDLTVKGTENEFVINALRVVAFPPVSSTSLVGISAKSVTPLLPDGSMLERILEVTEKRTMPMYLHFRQFSTTELTLSFVSELVVPGLGNAKMAGITLVSAELNSYPEKSYIGYQVPVPSGTTILSSIVITGVTETDSISGLIIKIYQSESEFNAISSGYIHLCRNSNAPMVSVSGNIWVLCEFSRTNGTSPGLESIVLTFQ